jgi:biopolymer transport protein ExbB/TolQ
MKNTQRTELVENLDQLYLDFVLGLFPTMEISEAQVAGLRDMWKKSLFRQVIADHFRKTPDEQFSLLQNLLQKFPLVDQKHLRSVRRSTHSLGGRTPLPTDHLRQKASEEIRNLQQRGLKLQRAIADVAPLYGLTPAQFTGIWKHKARYKD